jgi:hypothetical protein
MFFEISEQNRKQNFRTFVCVGLGPKFMERKRKAKPQKLVDPLDHPALQDDVEDAEWKQEVAPRTTKKEKKKAPSTPKVKVSVVEFEFPRPSENNILLGTLPLDNILVLNEKNQSHAVKLKYCKSQEVHGGTISFFDNETNETIVTGNSSVILSSSLYYLAQQVNHVRS